MVKHNKSNISKAKTPSTGTDQTTDLRVESVRKDVFGLDSFRPLQAEAIRHILKGDNVFLTLPTSGGKSICYQIPALLLREEGITIVVSPLIVLMRDQTRRLREKGISVACLDSLKTGEKLEEELEILKRKDTPLVYVSPERFSTVNFREQLGKRKVARLIVDEAHCVSEQGHDFRPSFLRIKEAAKDFGSPPITCVTATAPLLVRNDVLNVLGIKDAVILTGDIDRPNLSFLKERLGDKSEKKEALFNLLKKAHKKGEKTVVYCSRVYETQDLASELQVEMEIPAAFYHGQMEAEARETAYQNFVNGSQKILFATNAFGMGIDIPDIRNVIHYGVPESIEAYYQEAGRAGRDGNPAHCTILWNFSDLRRRRRLVDDGCPSVHAIATRYHKLWHSVPNEKKNSPIPVTYFSEEEYFKTMNVQSPKLQSEIRVSMVILEEFGFIFREGRKVGFLVKPDMAPMSNFPVPADSLRAREHSKLTSFTLIAHYLLTDEDPRNLILNHFLHNSVIHRVRSFHEIGESLISPNTVEHVLRQLTKKDWKTSELNQILRKGEKDGSAGPLARLTPAEVKDELEHMNTLGLLRIVSIDPDSVVTIADSGIHYLKKLSIQAPKLQTHEQLSKFIHSTLALPPLRDALKSWFTGAASRSYSPKDWWAQIEYFLAEKFDVLGTQISGKDLVQLYYMRRYDRLKGRNPIKSHAKEFLNYLFDNRIVT